MAESDTTERLVSALQDVVGGFMKDLSEAVADAEAFDRELVGELRRAVGHTVTVVTQKARSEHGWQDRTGATRESIQPSVDDNAKGASGTVTAGENAVRLNDGTRPHRIEAVRGNALRFSVGGQTLFRRGVNHPGTKPDHFLDRAADAAEEELPRAVEAAVDKALG
jgi:hypothetical protein